MSNTTAVYARIDNELKENAEAILKELGITPSSLITMLYSQIVLQQGLPFTPTLTNKKPRSLKEMSKEEIII